MNHGPDDRDQEGSEVRESFATGQEHAPSSTRTLRNSPLTV